MSVNQIIVGLDIGTTKVTTVIGEVGPDGVLDVIGEATVPSDGIKKGVVVNLDKTTQAIRQSIAAAERVAGVKVHEAFVSANGSHIKALTSHGLAAIRRNQEISRADVERAIENAQAVPLDPTVEILHILPQEYTVDGQEEIKNPIGMQGVRLEVDVHMVTGSVGPLANLRRCVQESGITPNQLVLQAYGAGLAVLDQQDYDHTVLVIDIGGGTTDIGVFRRGNLCHSAVIPIGGDHITGDIAQILKIPFEEAERIKKRYGSAIPELADPDAMLEITQAGVQTSISPFELSRIIKPRVAEIFALVRGEIDHALGPIEIITSSVILTGGTNMMKGMGELARDRFRLPVRLGTPTKLGGLKDLVAKPSYAAAIGLLRFAHLQDDQPASGATRTKTPVPTTVHTTSQEVHSHTPTPTVNSTPVPQPTTVLDDPTPQQQKPQPQQKAADGSKSFLDRLKDIFKDFF